MTFGARSASTRASAIIVNLSVTFQWSVVTDGLQDRRHIGLNLCRSEIEQFGLREI